MAGILCWENRFASMAECTPAFFDAGWEVDFRQLGRGSEAVELKVVAAGSSTLLRVELGNTAHQRALPPHGYVNFGVPARPQAPGKFGRRVLDSETLTCFSPANGLDVVSCPGFTAYTLSFCDQRLIELAQSLQFLEFGDGRGPSGTQKSPSANSLTGLRRYLDELFTFVATAGVVEETSILHALESELPAMVLAAWYEGEELPYARASARQRALKRALAYVYEAPSAVLTVEALCRESASSISTLERAFREHFGCSPKRYLTAFNLNAARWALLDSDGHGSIGDIAAQAGFWHPSKFAADYRAMFGELPSQTRSG